MSNETLPWWKRGLPVAILGAAIPVATFVQGWLQKDRELALQEKQQVQQFRAQYISVVSEAGVEGIEVLSDFIADTEQDPVIREWANKQRAKAREKIEALDKRIEAEQKMVKAAEDVAEDATRKKQRAEERVALANAQAKDDRARRETAEREAEAARQALAKAQANVATNEAKLSRSRDALMGRPVVQTRVTTPASKAAQVGVTVRDHRKE
jgi:chromosome segregation ATPase